jgi:hypothetical protein
LVGAAASAESRMLSHRLEACNQALLQGELTLGTPPLVIWYIQPSDAALEPASSMLLQTLAPSPSRTTSWPSFCRDGAKAAAPYRVPAKTEAEKLCLQALFNLALTSTWTSQQETT